MNLSICGKGTSGPDPRKIVSRAAVTVNHMPAVDPRVSELVPQIFAAEQSPWNAGRLTLSSCDPIMPAVSVILS